MFDTFPLPQGGDARELLSRDQARSKARVESSRTKSREPQTSSSAIDHLKAQIRQTEENARRLLKEAKSAKEDLLNILTDERRDDERRSRRKREEERQLKEEVERRR